MACCWSWSSIAEGKEKNLFPMPFFSSIYYCCFRNMDLPLWDNAPKAALSPLRDKQSSSWQQTVCGWPRQQRGPLLVTSSSAHRHAGEQFLPDRIQPQGLEKEKRAGTCTCVCICLYQTHLCMYMRALHICACVLHMHTMRMYKPSWFKQAGVWTLRDGVRQILRARGET